MAGQTCRVSQAGKEEIEAAIRLDGRSKTVLAAAAEISRDTLYKILNQSTVRFSSLTKLCFELGLNTDELIEGEEPNPDTEIEQLVARLRKQVAPSIQKRCGVMRILDMTQPIDSTAIYTDVNILERVTSKTREKLDELRQGMGPNDFDRFCLGQVKQERVPGLEALRRHKLLMILGKPGAGKTTFLKRLAMGCRAGQWGLKNRVPFFVSLKEFADDRGKVGSLLQFIEAGYELTTESSPNTSLALLLKEGRGLVLLDGLDEVQAVEQDRVLRDIREFARRYDQNQTVITCRIAAKEYIFEHFTEIEVADFNDEQIQDFTNKWFRAKEPEQLDEDGQSTIAQEFWRALKDNEPVRELANNPLLLTLLVLEFGDSFGFPSSRSELYERGLNVLLSKWDGSRRIRREEIYKKLPIKRKKRLLAQLAWVTFEKGDYFFKQKVAELQIQQYIQNLPDAKTDDEALLVDSSLALRAIEAQHGLLTQRAAGIYSFSHLTFHEYFAASQIAGSIELQKKFPSKISETRWREVFLLVSEQLIDASDFLMAIKWEADAWVSQDARIQEFLQWQLNKQQSVKSPYKSSAVRACYGCIVNVLDSDLSSNLSIDIARALDSNLNSACESARRTVAFDSRDLTNAIASFSDFVSALDNSLACDFAIAPVFIMARTTARAMASVSDLDNAMASASASDLDSVNIIVNAMASSIANAIALDKELLEPLKPLKQQIENSLSCCKLFLQWWEQNGDRWTQELRQTMITHRNIGHDWQFTDTQVNLLNQYYKANLLLIQCLNTECDVSRDVRQHIEDTLLLPYDELQKRNAAKPS